MKQPTAKQLAQRELDNIETPTETLEMCGAVVQRMTKHSDVTPHLHTCGCPNEQCSRVRFTSDPVCHYCGCFTCQALVSRWRHEMGRVS
jgi:hypothetical protein